MPFTEHNEKVSHNVCCDTRILGICQRSDKFLHECIMNTMFLVIFSQYLLRVDSVLQHTVFCDFHTYVVNIQYKKYTPIEIKINKNLRKTCQPFFLSSISFRRTNLTFWFRYLKFRHLQGVFMLGVMVVKISVHFAWRINNVAAVA